MPDIFCVVPSADEVVCLDRAGGSRRWAFRPEGQTIRSGEPPLVVPAGDSALVIVPLNIGHRVYRLDGRTGKALWREPLFLADATLAPRAWLADGDTVYHAAGERITARALADGKERWHAPLGSGARWRLAATGGAVLAWPAEAPAVRFSFRWAGGAVQYHIGPSRGTSVAVECLNAKDGKVMQRVTLELAGRQPRRVADPALAPSLVPLAGVVEDLASPALRVIHDARGLIIALANRARSLGPPRSSN